jgi:large subunit ribosomal protein L14e
MPSIEIGRICVKTMGGEKGKRCVIVDITNVNHVELLNEKIQIKRRASDDEIVEALRAK